MTRILVPAALFLFVAALPVGSAAQEIPARPPVRPSVPQPREFPQVLLERGITQRPGDARIVREQFTELLNSYAPSLRAVLEADPSLLENADFLAPYPAVAAYFKEHPEIVRDPAYFIGTSRSRSMPRTSQQQAISLLEGVLAGTAVLIGMLSVLFVLASLIRQAIAHRRWGRQSRVQTEVHTKILDRLQSNDELLAYIQTPAGQRFLESGPLPASASEPATIAAPFSRILWSVQAGVMLLALGVGLWVVQHNVVDEVRPAFNVMGVIVTALGLGAICSGLIAYRLSHRFGLVSKVRE